MNISKYRNWRFWVAFIPTLLVFIAWCVLSIFRIAGKYADWLLDYIHRSLLAPLVRWTWATGDAQGNSVASAHNESTPEPPQ